MVNDCPEWNERRNEMERDPVCGMYLVKVDETLKCDYKGTTYYFCCKACKEKFEKEPEKYVNALKEIHYYR